MKLVIDPKELKRRRLEARLSRRQLSALTIPEGEEKPKVSTRRIDHYELAEEGIWPESAQALAGALGCEVSDITKVVEVEQAAS